MLWAEDKSSSWDQRCKLVRSKRFREKANDGMEGSCCWPKVINVPRWPKPVWPREGSMSSGTSINQFIL